MSRVVHTGQALVDVVIEVPSLPRRGQNVMAGSTTRYGFLNRVSMNLIRLSRLLSW